MERIKQNRRFVLIGLFVVVLLCLVAALIFRIFFSEGDVVVVVDTPTPALTPTEEVPPTPPEAEATPTPTRVVVETPTEKPVVELTVESTPTTAATPTSQPSPTPGPSAPVSTGADMTGPAAAPRLEQLLQNGDFEAGFQDNGVAQAWDSFNTDSMVAGFSPETAIPYVKSGDKAQRITVSGSTQGDRYAGIYQQVEVAPGQSYTLTLNGQIRTGLGDIQASSYGYRMQYALDYSGGTDWRKLDPGDWVELPWDEQRLDAADPQFLNYTTTVRPTDQKLTLFVRTWNKWPDPGEVQYTLDSLSLVGPSPTQATTTETMIDRPLPTTGAGDPASLISDGRFWGALLILLLLAGGAISRARWEW